METHLKECRRKTLCSCGCQQYITIGQFVLVTVRQFYFKDGEVKKTRWKSVRYWIPEHWLRQAKTAIEERERLRVETRGRKKSSLSEEVFDTRKKIQARRASVVQRIKAEMSREEFNPDRVIYLGSLLQKCKEEIEEYGGVPKKW